jgi:hypothetical protein
LRQKKLPKDLSDANKSVIIYGSLGACLCRRDHHAGRESSGLREKLLRLGETAVQIRQKLFQFSSIMWVAIAIFAVSLVFNVSRTRAQAPQRVPATVVLQEVMHLPNGTKRMGALYHFAYRQDGASVFIGTSDPAHAENPVRLLEFPSGVHAMVSDSKQMKSVTLPAPGARPIELRNPASQCTITGDTPVSEETVNGYRTQKVTRLNMTVWYALDYGCAPVRDHFSWPDGASNDKYLVTLNAGDPDPTLFALPGNYADVPRSAFDKP